MKRTRNSFSLPFELAITPSAL